MIREEDEGPVIVESEIQFSPGVTMYSYSPVPGPRTLRQQQKFEHYERFRQDERNREAAYEALIPMEQRVYEILSGIGAEGTQWEDEIQGAKEIVEVFRASVI